jgi:hypothetical protein
VIPVLELLVMVCLPTSGYPTPAASGFSSGAALALRLAGYGVDVALVMTKLCSAPGTTAFALEHRP